MILQFPVCLFLNIGIATAFNLNPWVALPIAIFTLILYDLGEIYFYRNQIQSSSSEQP